jgi:hypothetical protein
VVLVFLRRTKSLNPCVRLTRSGQFLLEALWGSLQLAHFMIEYIHRYPPLQNFCRHLCLLVRWSPVHTTQAGLALQISFLWPKPWQSRHWIWALNEIYFVRLHERFPTPIVRPPSSVNETLPTKARTIVEAGLPFLSAFVVSNLGVWPSLAPEQYPSTSRRITSRSRWIGTPCNKNLVQDADSDAVAGPINERIMLSCLLLYVYVWY